MNKIKKGDIVQVMRGKDAGKKAEVAKVITSGNGLKVIIKGVNIAKKHRKPNPTLNIQGGIFEIERPIDVSNVMYFDEKAGKVSRIGFKVDEKTGKKVRFSKKSGEILK